MAQVLGVSGEERAATVLVKDYANNSQPIGAALGVVVKIKLLADKGPEFVSILYFVRFWHSKMGHLVEDLRPKTHFGLLAA